VFGEEFYYSETVNVAMSVSTSDPDDVDYFWECDGGTFLQRQGYSLNQWKAPNKAGIYKIKCTVTCGSAKQTREAEINVSGFFFEKFDNSDGSNSLPTGWAQSNSATQTRNKRMELQVTTAGKEYGEFRYDFKKTEFFPPFSCKSDVGTVGGSSNANNPKYPNAPEVFPFAGKDNNCAIVVTTNTPSMTAAPTFFISELRLEWWPDNHVLPELKYLAPGATDTTTIASTDFDAMLRFRWTRRANVGEGIPQAQGWFAIPIKNSALKYGVDVNKNIGLAIDEDYVVTANVNGVEVLRTEAIKNWRPTAGDAPMVIKEFKYVFPAKTRVYIDNVYVYLDALFGN